MAGLAGCNASPPQPLSCLPARPPRAALANLAPEQKPGVLSRLLTKVEQAKERVAAERSMAEEEAGSAEQVRASGRVGWGSSRASTHCRCAS